MCNHSKKSNATDFVYYKVDRDPIQFLDNSKKLWVFPPASEVYYIVETRTFETCDHCGVMVTWSSSIENMTSSGAKTLGYEFAGDSESFSWKGKVAIRGGGLIK